MVRNDFCNKSNKFSFTMFAVLILVCDFCTKIFLNDYNNLQFGLAGALPNPPNEHAPPIGPIKPNRQNLDINSMTVSFQLHSLTTKNRFVGLIPGTYGYCFFWPCRVHMDICLTGKKFGITVHDIQIY